MGAKGSIAPILPNFDTKAYYYFYKKPFEFHSFENFNSFQNIPIFTYTHLTRALTRVFDPNKRIVSSRTSSELATRVSNSDISSFVNVSYAIRFNAIRSLFLSLLITRIFVNSKYLRYN